MTRYYTDIIIIQLLFNILKIKINSENKWQFVDQI